jgi:hypothetical protein
MSCGGGFPGERAEWLGGMDKFPNGPETMRNKEKDSAASGEGIEGAAHLSSGVVADRFIGITQRRSRRLASQKMDSRRPVRQFVHTT